MTERHPPLRDPHLEEVAHWHPIEGTPMKKRVAIGCSVGATIETYDFIGFGIAAALYFNKVFFPATDPLSGTLLSFATLGIGFAVRPLGGIIGGYLGDKIGRKPVLVGSLLLMGIATVLIGCAADLPAGRRVGRDPAGDRPGRAGPGVRRRVGRRDPDVLRARPLAEEGVLHRHHPGRLPGGAAAGEPRVPGQRAAGRPVGVAGAVPAVRDPDRRRHHHPAQGRGVPGVRGAQGGGRALEEPAQGGSARRLEEHPARVLPAHRRDRRLRGVGDVHAVLHLRREAGGPAGHPDRAR